MTVGNSTYKEKKDAGAALATEILAKAKEDEFTTVGKFAGFELRVIKQKAEYTGHVTGAQSYKFNVYPENTTYMVNHIIGVVEGIDNKVKVWAENLAETKTDLAAQEKMIAEPFAKQAELEQKRAEEGQRYKEQQFGQNVDREAAAKTLERMKVPDSQISSFIPPYTKKNRLKQVCFCLIC